MLSDSSPVLLDFTRLCAQKHSETKKIDMLAVTQQVSGSDGTIAMMMKNFSDVSLKEMSVAANFRKCDGHPNQMLKSSFDSPVCF